MDSNIRRRLSAVGILLGTIVVAASAEVRTWNDSTGKFSVSAELVEVQGDTALLRRADGKELKVPLEKLCDADRAFLKAHAANPAIPITTEVDTAIADVATRFFGDLRTKERAVARQSLTKKAESVITGGKSPLADPSATAARQDSDQGRQRETRRRSRGDSCPGACGRGCT